MIQWIFVVCNIHSSSLIDCLALSSIFSCSKTLLNHHPVQLPNRELYVSDDSEIDGSYLC